MIELGVPFSKIILAAQQTLYMVSVSLVIGTVIAMVMAMKILNLE